jgi:hypothetical protein
MDALLTFREGAALEDDVTLVIAKLDQAQQDGNPLSRLECRH